MNIDVENNSSSPFSFANLTPSCELSGSFIGDIVSSKYSVLVTLFQS